MWIFRNWRLKVLSLVLALGLLGAVAFSENPPDVTSVSVKVSYDKQPTNIVLLNQPDFVSVRVIGLRDDVLRYQTAASGVSVDVSGAKVGQNQLYYARPAVNVPGVTAVDTAIPIHLDIEPLETRQLDIEIRTPNKSAGVEVIADKTYATCGNASERCQVTVTGPASVVRKLQAFVDYDVAINSSGTQVTSNEPIKFELNGRSIVLSSIRSSPSPGFTPQFVTVQLASQNGLQTKTLPLTVRLTGSQACGYALSAVDIQPAVVTVSGPTDAISRLGSSVGLDPVSISGITSPLTVGRGVNLGSDVQVTPNGATVRVSVTPAFSCAPATPIPSPKPSPT
jgi:YbbR domain-containing protein